MALDEFRGQGFYGHPLSGALVTSMALFMVLGMGLRGWRLVALFGIFVVGLMSFGGRGALATSLLILGAAALFQLTSGLATRRLNVGFLGAFIAGVFLLPALLVLLTTMTDIGLRVTSHLYLDDSADVRIVQWRVLSLLNVHDLLFGATGDRIGLLKAQIGLTGVGIDIENPWLLTFLALGVLGFPFLMAALFLFLWHLGRRVDTPIGWLIVIATLLICSTNNSLGRKVPDLMFLSGIMIALSGFKSEERESVAMAPVVSDPPDRTDSHCIGSWRTQPQSRRPTLRTPSALHSIRMSSTARRAQPRTAISDLVRPIRRSCSIAASGNRKGKLLAGDQPHILVASNCIEQVGQARVVTEREMLQHPDPCGLGQPMEEGHAVVRLNGE